VSHRSADLTHYRCQTCSPKAHDRLQYLLVITKLTSVFETFDSEPAAVASFAQDLKERSKLCGDKQEVEA
jgi:hypothetical protein